MEREKLKDFIFSPVNRRSFISYIKPETDEYEKCLRKRGSSCDVVLTGNAIYKLEYGDVLELEKYLTGNCSLVVRDYILTAIQLDECITKGEDVFDLLHDLTS